MAILYDTRLVGGKSAYNYAVEGGYSGTEEEFTQSLGEMGDIGITLTSTLVAGETTLVFTDDRITTDDVLNNVYTSKFGMSVKSAVFGDGTLTLEFPSQEEDIEVKVVINAILSLGGNGLDGKDGADGKSAYKYAVEGGYTGTEEEFAQLFNNMGGGNEWKLLGSGNNSTDVTLTNLPVNYNEMLLTINVSGGGRWERSSFTLLKTDIENMSNATTLTYFFCTNVNTGNVIFDYGAKYFTTSTANLYFDIYYR